MLRVVYYARVSTEEEKQLNALQKQTQELEQLIKQNLDWVLIDKYIDEGKSGTTTKNRNQYNQLFNDLSNYINIITFYSKRFLFRKKY